MVTRQFSVASNRSFKDVWRGSLRCWWRQNAQKYRLRWLLTAECQTAKLFWATNVYSDQTLHFAKSRFWQLFWATDVHFISITKSLHKILTLTYVRPSFWARNVYSDHSLHFANIWHRRYSQKRHKLCLTARNVHFDQSRTVYSYQSFTLKTRFNSHILQKMIN